MGKYFLVGYLMGYHGIPSGQAIRGWEILTSEGHPIESGKERSRG